MTVDTGEPTSDQEKITDSSGQKKDTKKRRDRRKSDDTTLELTTSEVQQETNFDDNSQSKSRVETAESEKNVETKTIEQKTQGKNKERKEKETNPIPAYDGKKKRRPSADGATALEIGKESAKRRTSVGGATALDMGKESAKRRHSADGATVLDMGKESAKKKSETQEYRKTRDEAKEKVDTSKPEISKTKTKLKKSESLEIEKEAIDGVKNEQKVRQKSRDVKEAPSTENTSTTSKNSENKDNPSHIPSETDKNNTAKKLQLKLSKHVAKQKMKDSVSSVQLEPDEAVEESKQSRVQYQENVPKKVKDSESKCHASHLTAETDRGNTGKKLQLKLSKNVTKQRVKDSASSVRQDPDEEEAKQKRVKSQDTMDLESMREAEKAKKMELEVASDSEVGTKKPQIKSPKITKRKTRERAEKTTTAGTTETAVDSAKNASITKDVTKSKTADSENKQQERSPTIKRKTTQPQQQSGEAPFDLSSKVTNGKHNALDVRKDAVTSQSEHIPKSRNSTSSNGPMAKGEQMKPDPASKGPEQSTSALNIENKKNRRVQRTGSKDLTIEIDGTKANIKTSMSRQEPSAKENSSRASIGAGKSFDARKLNLIDQQKRKDTVRSASSFSGVPVTEKNDQFKRKDSVRSSSSFSGELVADKNDQLKRKDLVRSSSSFSGESIPEKNDESGESKKQTRNQKEPQKTDNPPVAMSVGSTRGTVGRVNEDMVKSEASLNHVTEVVDTSTTEQKKDAKKVRNKLEEKPKFFAGDSSSDDDGDDIGEKLLRWKRTKIRQKAQNSREKSKDEASSNKNTNSQDLAREGSIEDVASQQDDDKTICANNKSNNADLPTEAREDRALVVRGLNIPYEIVVAEAALQVGSAAKNPRAAIKVKTNKNKNWKRCRTWTLNVLGDYVIRETQRSQYGGRLDVCEESTGFFYVKKTGERWFMIDPEGNVFLSVGVNAVNPLNDDNSDDKVVTAENQTNIEWAKNASNYLFSHLGFNSLGCWSVPHVFKGAKVNLPYCLHWSFMANYCKVRPHGRVKLSDGMVPCFDPEFNEFCTTYAMELLETNKDPWLIGHFSDTELTFKESDVLQRYLALPEADPGYQAASKWLAKRKKGRQDISESDNAEFCTDVVSLYFQVVSSAIKKNDPNHLFLGTRFQGPALRQDSTFVGCSQWVDVVSVNYYQRFTPEQEKLNQWSRLSGRPLIVTEWSAKGDDAPNCDNAAGGGVIVGTQRSRGAFYENFTISLLRNPNVVGWHWFRYMDKQKSNIGIVDANFNPYGPLANSMHQINTKVYSLSDYLSNSCAIFAEEPEVAEPPEPPD